MDLLQALHAFTAVAEHGSLTRCAAALGQTPSALSRQLAALEAQGGTRLFHRTGRGVLLSDAGSALLPRAQALLADAAGLMGRLRGEAESPAGVVDLGVVPAVRPIVAQLAQRVRADLPRLRLRAHEGFSGQVEDWLARGQVDVGLFNRYSAAKVRDAVPVLRTQMGLIARRGSKLVRGETLPFRQLHGVPLAAPLRPNPMLSALQQAAQRQRIELDFAFESGSEAILMEAVAQGDMATIVPRHVAQHDYGAERFGWARLVEPGLRQVTWLAISSARPATPATRAVAAMLREMTPTLAC